MSKVPLTVKLSPGEDCHQTAPDIVEAVRGLARILPDQQMAAWLGRAPAACWTSQPFSGTSA
jgi:hypothetical protein